MLLFEQPLNERIRNLISLEYYLTQSEQALHSKNNNNNIYLPDWQIIQSTSSFVSLMNFIERHDIRSDLLKEIERKLGLFNKIQSSPDLDPEPLKKTTHELLDLSEIIKKTESKLDSQLKTDYLLTTLRQKFNVNPSAVAYDTPFLQ